MRDRRERQHGQEAQQESDEVLAAGGGDRGRRAGVLSALLLLQSLPNEGKLALFLLGLAILAAVLLAFASRRGGVRCPNCGTRWGGNSFGMAARTHEGIFRCPHCGAMIPMK